MIRVDETDPVGELEPSFPYRDVTVRKGVEFKDYYDIESEIGRGKFGTVYRCKEKKTCLSLATKVVNTTRKEDRRDVEREVNIMRKLQHPRLIQLYDAIEHGKQIYVVLELIAGGELFERVIDDDFVLTERSCAVFMRQICEGIEFVHSQNILHLDMKPENILCLTKEGNRIKIIDFGLAREYDPKKKLQVLFGTPEFVAPEVVNFDQIGFGTDMWSIGVICYVLLSGLSPFMGDTDVETMANVTIAKYDFDHEAFADISEDAKDFIKCLLVKDITKRASAKQCREHRWLVRKLVASSSSSSTPSTSTITASTPATTTISVTASPIPAPTPSVASTSLESMLDVAKDNLRLFVERWREHPDSPYNIENPSLERQASQETASLRGQSPSPCGSICSADTSSSNSSAAAGSSNDSNASSVGVGGNEPGTPCAFLAVPELALTFERRASEGGRCFDKKGAFDPASQILLAEEIIRLSEHLRSIAVAPSVTADAVENNTGTGHKMAEDNNSCNNNHKKSNNSNEEQSSKIEVQVESKEENEISEKLSSIARQRKLNGTTFNGSRNLDKYSNVNDASVGSFFSLRRSSKTSCTSGSSSTSSNVASASSSSSTIATSINESSNENINSSSTTKSTTKTIKTTTTNNKSWETSDWPGMRLTREIDLTPPWRQSARVKRRFGETCRDVPRIAKLQDLHKNMSLNEPASTKDLLLQLIDEWSEVRRPGILGGRKSISLDWCGEESVARRSINSLAEYFQSEQQKQQKQQQQVTAAAGSASSMR